LQETSLLRIFLSGPDIPVDEIFSKKHVAKPSGEYPASSQYSSEHELDSFPAAISGGNFHTR